MAALAAAFCLVLAIPHAAGAVGGPPPRPASRPLVVLVAVPGLQWSDVEVMPTLRQFVSSAAVGELSVKTAGDSTRCAAGILAVSAGNRTTAPVDGCSIPANFWVNLAAANARSRYRATIGVLGTALQQAGVQTISVGDAATPLLANEQGAVTSAATSVSAALRLAAGETDGAVVAILDSDLYDAPTRLGTPGPAAVDRALAPTLSALPSTATVIVAGISGGRTGAPHLDAVAIRGPGIAHTELRSAAGRPPFVQLIDLAPTILSLEHVAVPSSVVGRAMQPSGRAVPPISKYVDDDRHATGQLTLGQRSFLILGIAVITLMLLPIVLPWQIARTAATWLARLLAPAPAFVYVMNAFPWWRWGQPVFAVLVIGAAVLVAAVTTFAARRGAAAAAAVPLAVTFGALALDQLTGAHLQFSAPLGDNPLVAGRLSGVGNLDFAAIATSAVLLAGIVGGWLGGRRGVAAAAAIAVVAIIIDGAPRLGNDIGGVLALVPGAIVLILLLLGAKLTWRRALLTAVAAAVVALGVALADYARPAASQTHVGRFVGQVLHGGAWTVVHRKLDAVLASFGGTVGTVVVAVAVVVVIVAWSRVWAALDSVPGLRAGAIAAAVTAVLGVALNDSGLPIAAMALMVGLGAAYGAIGGRPGAKPAST